MPAWTSSSVETPLRGRFYFTRAVCLALGLAALCASWLAANHYPPWTSFHGEAAAFAALGMVCLAQLNGGPVGDWRSPAVVAAGAALLLAVQWAAGQIAYGGDALLSGFYVVAVCWAWWAGHSAFAESRVRRVDPFTWFALTVVSGAVLSVYVGLLQWLRLETTLGIFGVDRGPDMRVFANLAQPNHLATLCAMAAILSVWMFRSGPIRAWHLIILLSWLAMGVTMSESRSGLLGAMLAGALVLLASNRLRAPARLLWPVLAWWIFLALGAMLWGTVNDALHLQASRTAQFSSDGARMTMWRQSLAAIEGSPWWGYGWRQTMYAQKMAAAEVPGWLATDYAHNAVLDLMIWVGVPAATVLLAVGAWWVLRSFCRIRNDKQAFLLICVTPFLLHSCFEFPFAYSYFLFPVAWVFGHLAAAQRARPEEPSQSRRARPWMLAALGASAALGIAIAVEYFRLEEDYRVMRFELRRVGRTPAGYQSPDIHLLTQLDQLVKVGRFVPRRQMPADELAAMRTASERNGWATLDVGYAAALGLNGSPQEAARRLQLIADVYGKESGRQARALFGEFSAQYPELDSVPTR